MQLTEYFVYSRLIHREEKEQNLQFTRYTIFWYERKNQSIAKRAERKIHNIDMNVHILAKGLFIRI